MAQKSQPWDNNGIGDASFSPYSAQEWADVWSNLANYGVVRPNYGVVRGSNPASTIVDALAVTVTSPISNQVTLKPGAALVDGTQYTNDADLNFTIAANASGNSRIDTLILRKDFTAQTIRAAILQGTPAASPVPAALTQSALFWEIPIADITVANGFATLNDSTIRMRSEAANIPDAVYMDGVLNFSGGTLEDGDAVIWGGGQVRSVVTTSIRNHITPAGIWRGRTLNGEYGRLQVSGIALARSTGVNAVQAIGDECVTGATAKILEGKTTSGGSGYIARGKPNSFGTALSVPDVNSGKFLIALNVQRRTPGFWYVTSQVNNTINSTTLTAMNFNIQTLTGQYGGGGLLVAMFCRVNRTTIPRFQFRVGGVVNTSTYDGSPVGVSALGIVDNMVSWAYFSQFAVRNFTAPLIEILWANNAGGALTILAGEISMIAMEIGNEQG